MKTLSLQLPDEVNEKELKMTVAAVLFEKGTLSSGQAAALVGITKRQFIETVGLYGVTIFNESASDLDENFQ
jgi:predicted HTH domain antitoxin